MCFPHAARVPRPFRGLVFEMSPGCNKRADQQLGENHGRAPNGRMFVALITLTTDGTLVRIIAVEVPVLWITGPAGVGKSTVSWQIFSELAEAGVHVAFADADQFGMCYPAPPGDPARERIKAQNVGALIPPYRAAGADCVIVNGCLDPDLGVLSELMPQADLTVCRLRAEPEEVVRRYTERDRTGGDLGELLQETIAEAHAMDATDFADACVDTTGVGVAEVVELVRASCRDWPGFGGSPPDAHLASGDRAEDPADHEWNADDADGSILLICGPAGVGKSTIGFELYLRYVRDGLTAGYVDLDQIAFIRPGSDTDPGRHRLKAGNLAAMWRTYRAAGATHLIATGPLDSEAAIQAYVRTLPAASVTVCRLHAGREELTRRIMSRGEGGSWPQPGDPLRGQSAEYLRRVADQAVADAPALDRAEVGTFRIDTDGRTVAESADLIAAMIKGGLNGRPERMSRCTMT
jgi:broad-specificity NMP kinase